MNWDDEYQDGIDKMLEFPDFFPRVGWRPRDLVGSTMAIATCVNRTGKKDIYTLRDVQFTRAMGQRHT